MAQLIAITGGIGSGKSVVSRILRTMGYPVYDTDSNARRLMDTSAEIRERLVERFGASVYGADGRLDRARLGGIVFASAEALARLNGIVHPAVAADVRQWAAGREVAFFETAILRSSGMWRMASAVWRVDAPVDVRIARVVKRNGLSPEAVGERIAAQQSELTGFSGEHVVVNDGRQAVLPQIVALTGGLAKK